MLLEHTVLSFFYLQPICINYKITGSKVPLYKRSVVYIVSRMHKIMDMLDSRYSKLKEVGNVKQN